MTAPNKTRTTCPYCGVGCGVLAWHDEAGRVKVAGDPDHPANFGRLCSKGAALHETVDLDGRLLAPEIDGRPSDWDTALDAVAAGFRRTLERHGPDAIAFYVSGQLLTEDYYVANKLMKGFLGSANIDTNSRLCMASSVAGYKRAFGADTVPGCYEDLEQADLVVLTGSNLAWCHPVVYQRLKRAKQARPELRVVVVDPRRTDSCEIADLHLPLAPGSDVALFNGLLAHLVRHGRVDFGYLERHVEGYGEAIGEARPWTVPRVAAECRLNEETLLRFYDWFAATERTVSVWSQGVNQSSAGTDKVNAIINCHLLTGRIGRPGMGPFSITGQPNAMGGREVGGLANQLAAHMDFQPEQVDRVRRFWNAPRMATRPGLKAVELFEAMDRGEIRAVWIMATNPVVSLPDADRVRRALGRCDLVVVSDCIRDTDTVDLAHIRLPALAWGEKDGTVTNSERRISRQRPFLPAPGQARSDWWQLAEVGRRLGDPAAFGWASAAEVFAEYAALTHFENDGRRDLDLGGLMGLGPAAYDELSPVQWPVPAATGAGTPRMFADGGYFTGNGKARMIATEARPPAYLPDLDYPLVLNTGRVRDHWHTLTRTGRSPRLNRHLDEPYAALHPLDAEALGLGEGDLVAVESRWGQALVRVRRDSGQQPGQVFVPMHWNDQFSARARIDAVVNPAVDPISGEPEFKHTPVRLRAQPCGWHGFLMSATAPPAPPTLYWTRIRGDGNLRYSLADAEVPTDWRRYAQGLLGGDGEWLEFQDPARGQYRAARLRDGRLVGCFFAAAEPTLPDHGWLAELLTRRLSTEERLSLLSGRAPRGRADTGRIVCACFGVGETALRTAIAEGAHSTDAITRRLKAGGNCGSCLPEIKRLIEQLGAAPA